jgi:type IV secretion system protein VirB9
MHSLPLTSAAAWLIACTLAGSAHANNADPRLREVWYDPQAVVTVPVKRGIVTHVALDPGEAITDVGSGLGADCSKPDASWCIAAQAGGRHIFVKPKSTASTPNNLAVVTDKRTHAFRFVVLAEGDARQPVYRLSVKAPAARAAGHAATRSAELVAPTVLPQLEPLLAEAAPAAPAVSLAERLAAAPELVNSNYSIAEGAGSSDIVPTLVFDDGRFTYFRFPNNREVPAVFNVLGDSTETVANARMEGDLLVVDRVSRRLMLRAGSAVVGVWNEAFDLDGLPPTDGTTVAGVRRVLKAEPPAPATAAQTGSRP